MAATARQLAVYHDHKRRCGILGIPQMTLEHKSLQGSLSTASPTGNKIYSGPGPLAADPTTTNTSVWAVTEPMVVRGTAGGGSATQVGRQAVQLLRGQCPAIDDSGSAIAISHDDWLVDAAGLRYRISNPVPTPDDSLWSFNLVRQR